MTGTARSTTNPNWQLLAQRSPLSQREWTDQWPEASSSDDLHALEALKKQSQPLAMIATVRAPSGELESRPARLASWQGWNGQARGLTVRPVLEDGHRRLAVEVLQSSGGAGASDADAFTLLIPDESILAPLRSYLESEIVRNWLEHKAERRAQRWVLREADLRILPVPSRLIRAWGGMSGISGGENLDEAGGAGFATPLPGNWEKIAASLPLHPRRVREALQELPQEADYAGIRASIFVRASRILNDLRSAQARLEQWVAPEGRVIWREIIATFQPSDFVPVTLHSGVELHGQMPLQTPITGKTLSRVPQGITLTTEAGHLVSLRIADRLLLDAVWDQIQALDQPTWSEIIEFVRAPRRTEQLESRAVELLRVHGEQSSLLAELRTIVSETLHSLV